jgi:hypothetical protein
MFVTATERRNVLHLLNVSEMAAQLGVDVYQMYREIRRGQIRSALEGGCTLDWRILNTQKKEKMKVRLVHENAITPDPIYQKRDREWFIGRCVKIAFEPPRGNQMHLGWLLSREILYRSLWRIDS